MKEGSGIVAQPDVDIEEVQPSSAPNVDVGSNSDELAVDVQRWIINLFIIFHVVGVICWNLPSTDLQIELNNVYKPYFTFTGCWQNWCMFSPDPVNVNIYLGATIHYKNGAAKDYTFPRISRLSWMSKYRHERWRKFIENTEGDGNTGYWPYLARYAAIVNNYAPTTNPVVSVDLYRFFNYIPSPGTAAAPYTKVKMLSEHVIAMPSPEPLIGGGRQ